MMTAAPTPSPLAGEGWGEGERPPTVPEYCSLRDSVGWGNLQPGPTEAGLRNSLFAVCALEDDHVIGCARVVGDGAIYFYIQDVIVHPSHQGKGAGGLMMNALMKYIRSVAQRGAFVGLMAAKNVDTFYEKYGFSTRNDDLPGMELRIRNAA